MNSLSQPKCEGEEEEEDEEEEEEGKEEDDALKKYTKQKGKNQILHNSITEMFSQCTGKSIEVLRNNKYLYSCNFCMCLPHITAHCQKL
jgi:hypothetical protein